MPFYEYECSSCGHRLEVLQKISDAPLASCPQCNQDTLKKLISAAGFRLKGSGWYETDFKNSGSGKGGDAKKAVKGQHLLMVSDVGSIVFAIIIA